MKRISTDFNPFRFFLVGALLAAQFGCASVQKPPYFYSPPDKIEKTIERPDVSACTPSNFDTKLDEVRKKTRLFVATEASADSLLTEVEALSGTTKEIYKKADKRQRKAALVSGAIAWMASFMFIMSWDLSIKDEASLVKDSPFIALIGGGIGALAGYMVGGSYASKKLREKLPTEKVRPLDSLVVLYNTYIAEQGEAQP